MRASVSDTHRDDRDLRVTSRGDKVEQAVDTVIPEPRITLDT